NQAEDDLAKEPDKPIEPSNSEEGNLNVEIVPGNVTPLEEKKEDNKEAPGEELTGENAKKPNKKAEEKAADRKTEKEPAKAKKGPAKEVLQEEVKYYTVKMGDTLAGISYKLYNSANYITKIMELNNIEDEDVIFAGQRLIVP
ncbi:MAG TPA: hypothetical protein DDY59_03465, partial [Lachnospiraceae bacterium]|nr:hypothetical protein [Lachnospiraceae bacterium]